MLGYNLPGYLLVLAIVNHETKMESHNPVEGYLPGGGIN